MKTLKWVCWLVLFVLVAGCKVLKTGGPRPVPASQFKVVGYFTPGTVEPERLRMDLLTHVNYSFAIPAKSGDTLLPIQKDDVLKRLIKHVHKERKKVFLSVGGWWIGDEMGDDSRFHRIAETADGRARFISSVLKMVDRYEFDGVDLDWEYPDEDSPSAGQYTLLVKALGNELHAKDKQLTAAVISRGKKGYGIEREAFEAFDWINLMAYDDDYGKDYLAAHSPYSLAQESYQYWVKERKLPAEKAVLGLPFYSKKGFGQYGPDYRALIKDGAGAYDDYHKGAFYNGINTIEAKTRFARVNGCGGVMIWEIGLDTTDDTSLLRAIDRARK